MSASTRKGESRGLIDPATCNQELTPEVVQAKAIEWGVIVDAYLVDASRVGQRYAAKVFSDLSGVSEDGMTVATPPLELVEARSGFRLMRSLIGNDYFVIVCEQQTGEQ
ncbi:hypothetical protein BV326_01249 [Pseudomonas syringae pv. actinidiae]|uniref:hypothetical protein n=1 Tax=Pseudomonas syringae TaxID=317 RepID=UPI000A21A469|nr:hypothetical protein [Pseudomonas syringae]OSR74430.1 hypothetical protein BV326_01249 [Pseudomonas syringae pv. actinidiae]